MEEEEQTTQQLKEKVQKDKQRSTKLKHKTKDRVARFIYRTEFDAVMKYAYRLKDKPFGISEQFPSEIESRRKELYPILKRATR